MRGVFVTGTGTEVGKTVVAAVIARTLVAAGERVAVFKPAVTGLDDPGATLCSPMEGTKRCTGEADHELLRRAANSTQSDEEIAPYRYGPPASPHLAAEMAGEEINPERLLQAARAAALPVDALICEGVGGLLVPLAGRVSVAMGDKVVPQPSERYLVRDLASNLGLPVVIAAAPGLGTINHTLLTIEATRAAGLEVAAVVLTPWPEDPNEIEESNRKTIASLGEAAVLSLPRLDLSASETWPPLSGLVNG
ncbi:MAG TPA: ATP-dependent dethiobiotin synthetase BioD [Solirubrobacterales bacterium]|nr:ATP-dependent dethiobiotin synthetase BioD [Solirubrobacterales bacterium]